MSSELSLQPEFTLSLSNTAAPLLIADRLERWAATAPAWETAHLCRRMVDHFSQRTASMRQRFGMPLIVATLGGTGTGKSSLINALLGAEVVQAGKERPTTDRPVFVCHPEIDPRQWGIDTSGMILEKHHLPALERLVLIDCPDPDTTENEQLRETNLARLRVVLPICDVILITGTQQKYRSRRVADELAEAAPGARLIFVQTHADRDVDIREDWQTVLAERYEPGRIFLVDSVAALKARLAGKPTPQDFTDLFHLLTRDLNEEAAIRIRYANFADLAEETIHFCHRQVEEHWPPVERLRDKILEERRLLGQRLAERMREELVRDRRLWESRLIGRVASQWGYSPFSLVLRVYQGLGSLISGALLARARSIPQLAVWGVFEGTKTLKKWKNGRRGTPGASIVTYWEEGNLRESAMILAGFVQDARLLSENCTPESALRESTKAGAAFIEEVSRELEKICDRLARRNNTWRVRVFYETLLGGMLLFLLFRPAKNFFWDTIFDAKVPLLGVDYYLISFFWLLAWSAGLLGLFTFMLRQGLDREITETAATWSRATGLASLFHGLEMETNHIVAFRLEIDSLAAYMEQMNQMAEKLDKRLGHRKL